MLKRFTHHDRWWFARIAESIDWIPMSDIECLLLDFSRFSLEQCNIDRFYHYVAKDDTLWSISKEDTLTYMRRTGIQKRWHISRTFLTPEPITEEWRKQIKEYGR